MSTIILASESFLKNFILEKSGIDFKKVPAEIDESIYDNEPVEARVELLAENKCGKIAKKFPDSFIIAADTLTSDENGSVYTKPKPGTDSFKEAMSLSGKEITIYTGCCVYSPKLGMRKSTSVSSLFYQNFTEEDLRQVIGGDNSSIRSGALGIFFDSPGFTLIDKISGSYTGSFGLPMEFIRPLLVKHLGKTNG